MRLHNALLVLLVFVIAIVSSCAQYSTQQETPKQQEAISAPTKQVSTPSESKPTDQSTGSAQAIEQAVQPTVKEFKVTARQFQYEPSAIEVNKGDKVKLIVTSIDVPHGFSIPEYGVNERLDVGKPVTIEFTADKQGTFTAFCSVFCGSGHSGMKGKLIVK